MTILLILTAAVCGLQYILLFLAAATALLLVLLGREIAKLIQTIVQIIQKENVK